MDSFILFATSDFGLYVADYLYNNFDVKAVVTSTPKPKGRHFIIEDIEIVKNARLKNIPIIYINKSSEIYDKIKDIKVDYFLIVDFAFILKKNVLELPKNYCINIHPSKLPQYRGPSPLHFQIIDNVKKTGISVIKMNEYVDAGDILFQLILDVEDWLTFSKFYNFMQKAAEAAFEIFFQNINMFFPIKQDEKLATYTRKIIKQDAFIDFEKEDFKIAVGKIKAFEKWPKVKIKVDDDIFVLLDAEIEYGFTIKPGYVRITDEEFLIGAKNGTLSILKIQRAGKSAQNIKTFLKGYRKRFFEEKLVMGFNL